MQIRWVVAAVFAAIVLTGCGAGANPETIPPQGVDGLVIPASSLDPDLFVAEPESPWLPEPGVGTINSLEDGSTMIQTGGPGPLIAGIRTVEVSLALEAEGSDEWTSFYAVDRDGNVWLLGERVRGVFGERDWRLGRAGAEAGLAIPATPRRGDGYLRQRVSGGPRDRISTERIAATDEQLREECGDCVELQLTTRAGATITLTYQRGRGMLPPVPPGGWQGQLK